MNVYFARMPVFALLVMTLQTDCWAQSLGILGGSLQDPMAVAADGIDSMMIDIQSEPTFATCYMGRMIREGAPLELSNGSFSFIGFYARGQTPQGGRATRIWSTKDFVLDGQLVPYSFTTDRCFDGKTWAYTRFDAPITEVDPNEEHGHYRFRCICLDSRLAVAQYALAIGVEKALSLNEVGYFSSPNLIHAERAGRHVSATLRAPAKVLFHCLMDPAFDNRPSKVVVTENEGKLLPGDANAVIVNELRWEKTEGDRWIGAAGRNVQYVRGTKQTATERTTFEWKAAWWFGDDVKPEFFEKSNLSSYNPVLFNGFREYIDQASKVNDFD